MRNQVMELQSKLSRTESNLDRSQQEVQHYKSSEARYTISNLKIIIVLLLYFISLSFKRA